MSDILGLLAEHPAGRKFPSDARAACSPAETEQAHVSELHGGWGCRLTKPVPGPALWGRDLQDLHWWKGEWSTGGTGGEKTALAGVHVPVSQSRQRKNNVLEPENL